MSFRFHDLLHDKATRLFVILAGFFISNAIIAEFLGVKIISVEKSIGIEPFQISLFGMDNLSFNMAAGVVLWPVVFVMTDVINEYYGRKGVQLLSFLTMGLITYGFIMFAFTIKLQPADFWPTSHINPNLPLEEQAALRQKVGDYNTAFGLVFGQGNWIIIGSITAFMLGQLIDVFVFHRIKKMTGERLIWLRSTGSTLISQFVDSFVVLFIAFYLGADWSMQKIIALGMVAYLYKFTVAILMTPIVYLMHHFIDSYLGEELATELKYQASLG